MIINGETHSELCVGIDLGTTNSVIATVNLKPNGNIVSKVVGVERAVDMYNAGVVKFAMKNDQTLPSCVYYPEERNFVPVVGNYAKSRYGLVPHLVAKSIKSQMGNAVAEGLSPNVPDKTPAQISARILEHLLRNVAKIYRQNVIEDVVITVPASFDSVMCQATLEAARLAGVKIFNANGTIRQILLPEPQAVIYDFINQVHNDEVASSILDLSSQKIVAVFDIGGGTLDVTIHRISRREDAPDVLNVKDLAINRYTLLGGDDFDLALAQKMYEHYLEQYRTHSEIVQKIKREEKAIISQLLSYSEDLKIQLSMDKSGNFGVVDDAWGSDETAGIYPVGGGISATGYAYDDTFTVEDLEKIWQHFMGLDYKFDDFKNLDENVRKHGTKNIIYPILDVLKKCAEKLGTEDFKIDAVIMNGGMSRFYMIRDRLKEFFGFEPIVALDPDQSVARGAAVYHYFLHKYDERVSSFQNDALELAPEAEPKVETVKSEPAPYIRKTNAILPDSLFLQTQGERFEEIIATGAELPHKSKLFTGFKLPPNASKISIPIARRNLDGDFVIIAKGNIRFPLSGDAENFVAFTVTMNEQKIIHMDAYTCRDMAGEQKLSNAATEIAIATNLEKAERQKPVRKAEPAALVAPIKLGPPIAPMPVLSRLVDYCRRVDRAEAYYDNSAKSKYSALIRDEKEKIYAAGNPEDFADPLLKIFSDNLSNECLKMNCEIIGRKIGMKWTDSQKRRLAYLCMQQLQRDIAFPRDIIGGPSVNTKIQAILTLWMCGDEYDWDQLKLLANPKFKDARLKMHALTKTNVDWIYEEFAQDCRRAQHGQHNHTIQTSAHAIGASHRLDNPRPVRCATPKSKIVNELIGIILARCLNTVETVNCILAIGLLCDQRYINDIEPEVVESARHLLQDIGASRLSGVFAKSRNAALKMIEGAELTADEEEMLLIKVD